MDQRLVVRAKDGDPEAFRALAMASHPRLFGAAFGILRDRGLAEDATQRALVDVWRHFRGLKDPGRFEGWSYRILLHACYAEARRRPTWVPDDELPPGREPRAEMATPMTTAIAMTRRPALLSPHLGVGSPG